MSVQEPCFGSIKFCRGRFAALDSSGVPNPGADNLAVVDYAMRWKWSPNYQTGQEITVPNGCGDLSINHKDGDRLKWWDVEFEVALPEPELTEMLLGGVVLQEAGTTVGYAAPELGIVSAEDGVSAELWSLAKIGDQDPTSLKYIRWVFPKCKNWKFAGERELNNGPLVNVFTAEAVENDNFWNGPANDWSFIDGRAWAYARTNSIPDAICGTTALQAS